jgi:hypothetical protein
MHAITFMGDMVRENAALWIQHTFGTQPVGMLDNLMGAPVVTTGLVWAIGMIERSDHELKSEPSLPERLPSLFEQRCRIRPIEDRARPRLLADTASLPSQARG